MSKQAQELLNAQITSHEAHPINQQSHHLEQQLSKDTQFMFDPQNYTEVHWSAAFIDNKYMVAHPLALDKLLKLEEEIKIDKNRLIFNQMLDEKLANQLRDSNPQGLNANDRTINSDINEQEKRSIRPDSSLSRQCNTEINYHRQLKTKIQVEKQLMIEQEKYKRKLEEMKKKREFNLKNSKHGDFMIRESVDKSSHRSGKSKKSSFNKSNMVAPHELIAIKNNLTGSKVSEKSKNSKPVQSSSKKNRYEEPVNTNNYISFHPNQAFQSPRFDNIQKTDNKSITNKSFKKSISRVSDNLNSQSRDHQIFHKKSDISQRKDHSHQNKSFVISYKHTPSNSRSKDPQNKSEYGNRRRDLKSASSVGSKIQIQKLNKKIKEMQQKLQYIQIRQNQLENTEKSRIKELEQTTSRIKTKLNQNISKEECASIKEDIEPQDNQVHNKQQVNEQMSISQRICESPKLEKSNTNSVRTESIKHNQQESVQKNSQERELQESNNCQKDEKNSQQFNILVYRNKRLNFSSSIVNYNYSEDMQNMRKEQLKNIEKQKLNQEINQLKKTIRELKLEKIHHESIIEQLEAQEKEKQREIMEYMKKSNYNQKPSNNEKNQPAKEEQLLGRSNPKIQEDSNSRKIKQQGGLSEHLKTQKTQKSQQENVNNFVRSKMIVKSDSSDMPIPKKDVLAGVKTKLAPIHSNPPHQTTNPYQNQSKVSPHHKINRNNPEESLAQYSPSGLARKGIIVRQVMTNQALNEQVSFDHNRNIINSHELEPSSSRQGGKKIFELQFVKAQRQQLSEQIQDLDLKVPEITMQPLNIPELPPAPSPTITQAELVILSDEICEIFGIDNSNKQHYMKKYKNCVIFKTPDPKKTVVWHYQGKFYIGGWQQNYNGQGKKTGEGYEYVPNRYCYNGQFYEGKKNGNGTMVSFSSNGHQNVYIGQWNMGCKHGIGKYYDAQQNSYYYGEFQNNKKQGKGILKINENQFYDGTFIRSIKDGYGIEKFANGDAYKGQYKQGRFHGRGKYYWANGSSYDGHFISGHREGSGRWRSAKKGGDLYIGQYRKDKKEGRGQYLWSNGCRYDGLFRNDLKNGQGRVQYPDGRQIKGCWQQGKLVEIDQKITENDDSCQSQEPLKKPKLNQIFESPSKQLRHSKYLHKI